MTCCTIQYGEDTGVCMLDNCSCHTPKTIHSEDTNERKLDMKPADETGYTGLDSEDWEMDKDLHQITARPTGRVSMQLMEFYNRGLRNGASESVVFATPDGNFLSPKAAENVRTAAYESALREALESVAKLDFGERWCTEECEKQIPCKHDLITATLEKVQQVITARLLDT